jgi:DNA-binding PadR family transcriptional regulator
MISDLEAVVLGILSEKPSYGYEIESTIQDRSIRYWTDIAFSSIYYVLRRLEEQSLVESTKDEVDGRLRKMYKATDAGEEELATKLGVALLTLEKHQPTFNLGVGFMGRLGLEESLRYLERRRLAIREKLQTYSEALEGIKERDWPFYVRGLYTRPMALLEAEEAWLEEYIEEIRVHEEQKNHPAAID